MKTEHEPARRIRRWLLILVLDVVVIAVALLVVEVLVRGFGDLPDVRPIWASSEEYVYERSDNPILSYELKANYRNDDADLLVSYERTNAHHMRDVERTVEKPAGSHRIILLGDSVVEGVGIRENETISRSMEALYGEDRTRAPTEVLNLAVSGYCTLAEVELLQVRGLRFSPDAVVLVFVENDFLNFNREAFPLGESRERPAIVKTLFVRSHAFRLLAIRFNLFGFGADADPARFNRDAIGDSNVVEGLARLRELARNHGFAPLIAVWPAFTDDGVVDPHSMPDGRGPLVIERLAGMYGMPTVRLSNDFTAHLATVAAESSPRLLYTIGDGQHPSPAGARIAAGAIVAALDRDAAAGGEFAGSGGRLDAAAIAAAAALGAPEPDYGRLYSNLGARALTDGRLDEAMQLIDLALGEDPDNAGAHYNRGRLLEMGGELDAAAESYATSARLSPESARAHNALGVVRALQEDTNAARAHFEEALRADPSYAKAHVNLGVLHDREGNTEAAERHFQEAIRFDPENVEARFRLALRLEAQGQLQRSLELLRVVLRLDPRHARAHNLLGVLLARTGQLELAARHFESAVQADPTDDKARRNLEQAREQLDR